MRTPLMLALTGMLATWVFLTGDKKRMKMVRKWAKKGNVFRTFSGGMVKKALAQLRW